MNKIIIVALDVPWAHEGWTLATKLIPRCTFFKVGMELFLDAGISFVRQLSQNDKIFLDLKLADTPDTIRRTVERICRHKYKPVYLSVRGEPAVITAALKGRGDNEYPKIIHVPRLSSQEERTFDEYYLRQEIAALEQVGCEGYVASGRSRIRVIRQAAPETTIISPGIRLEGQDRHNHRHYCLPHQAIEEGANHIVVGRPIIEAEDTVAAFNQFKEALHVEST